MKQIRIATTQFSLNSIESSEEFYEKSLGLVAEAAAKGAIAILLPEYFSLAQVTLPPKHPLQGKENFHARLRRWDEEHRTEFLGKFQQVAQKEDIWIIAGTVPTQEGGKLLNRCYIFSPQGKILHQDKIHMTRFEKEEWKVDAGVPALHVFTIAGMKCAVNICYDVEFPQLSQALLKEKIDLLLVPSCTDDIHGYWRVRHCAQARAIENQAYIAVASIVGGQKKFPELESHYGQAGVFSPCDTIFPEQGILAEGILNKEALLVVELDLSALQEVRKSGTVLNLADGGENSAPQIIQG